MKILIICSNLIGDTILSTGVFNFLAQENPKAKFTFVIGPTAGPLLKNFKRLLTNKILISIQGMPYKILDDCVLTGNLSLPTLYSILSTEPLLDQECPVIVLIPLPVCQPVCVPLT